MMVLQLGSNLGVKVRLDVRKWLLRGVTMQDEDGVEDFGALSNMSSSQISGILMYCWGTLIRM